MMLHSGSLLIVLGLTMVGCAHARSRGGTAGTAAATSPRGSSSAAAHSTENPFFHASTLPYQAPPFDIIRVADYQPALEEGMKQQLAEMQQIANDPAAPTFENTILPMERSGALLTRAAKVFFALTQANTDSTLQEVQKEEAPRLA